MRTSHPKVFKCDSLTVKLIVFLLSVGVSANAQKRLAVAQRYDDADAYEIYSLLLPDEESYAFAKETLLIQESTVSEDMYPVGPCLKLEDAKEFKGAIADYSRINKRSWLFQRKFQIAKPYRIVNAKVISTLPDQPQGAVSYVSMSPVGFNHEKTQAVVFIENSCGGLCGSWQFHFLAKVPWQMERSACCRLWRCLLAVACPYYLRIATNFGQTVFVILQNSQAFREFACPYRLTFANFFKRVLIDSSPHEFSFRNLADSPQLFVGRNRLSLASVLDHLKIQEPQVLALLEVPVMFFPDINRRPVRKNVCSPQETASLRATWLTIWTHALCFRVLLVRVQLLEEEFSYTSPMRKLFFLLISAGVLGGPQVLQPVKAQGATTAVIDAFANHDIVMLAEWHADKQEHEWLRQLVSTPVFADRVDDIVMEIGNSLYQKSVDRYVSGENIPFEKVEKAWRNTVGSVGAPSPVYGLLYKTVREVNLSRRGKHQIRIVCGDPYINWQKVRTLDDVGPYLGNRDKWYAQVVKTEVLAKKHHALLIAGGAHFLRWNGPGYIEGELRAAGANPYLVAFGTNAVGAYDDLDKRFDSWPLPAVVPLASNWVGDLPAMPVLFGGTVGPSPLKLGQVADALLYFGQRDSLRHTFTTRSELQGTAYGKEIARRQEIEFGQPLEPEEQPERPEFVKPSPDKAEGVPVSSPIPKTIGDPLPPKPRLR